MKKIFFVLFCLQSIALQAQKPETVYSVARERKSMDWYLTQQKLWKDETVKNKLNANAWYNYYSATRALKNSCYDEKDPEGSAKKKDEFIKQGNQIVEEAYKSIPNSFEANHMKWWDGNNNPEMLPFLMKAYEIDPNDVRAFADLMIHYEIKRDKTKFKQFTNQLFLANDLPSSLLNWGYNLLSELDLNAIVFTAGDNDTYAGWIAQGAKNFREDVTVINTYLITDDDYRNKIFEELKIPVLDIKVSKGIQEDFEKNQQLVFEHILKNKVGIPVYVSTTAISYFENKFAENLFLTGLSYKYSDNEFDNISIIQRNYESRYLLDYLKQNFSFHQMNNHAKYFDETYIPSMLKLYKHYQESESLYKMKNLEPLILSISENSGQQTEIFEFLSQSKSDPNFLTALLDAKTIEENMIQISIKVKMSRYETTNEDYQKFLDNVLRSKQLDLYKMVVYDSSQWIKKFPQSTNEPMETNYHWHPAYKNYPIVNISHDAAIAYCAWLTEQYNLQRKRKYTKVVFRLPTDKEWKYAAGAGNENAKSAFTKDEVKNEKGRYLANIKTGNNTFFEDGAFYTAKVGSYLANKLGFFNMTGNVAEMTNVKGIAKGGSWYNTFEESDFQKKTTYIGADPGIGFRIVMEIIEE